MKLELNRVSLVVVGLSLPLAAASCKSKAPKADSAKPGEVTMNQPDGQPAGAIGVQDPNQQGGNATPDAEAQRAFEERVKEERLRQERDTFRVEDKLARAKRSLDAGSIQEAYDLVEDARRIQPANERVLALRDQIATLLGDRAGQIGASAQEFERMEQIRKQKTRVDLDQALSKARENLTLKEFDRALSEADHALDILQWSPYAGDWTDMGAQARELKAKILSERDAEKARMRAEQERSATAKMRQEESEAAQKRAERIAARITVARNAYISHDYRGARDVAEQVLREDSRNQRALEIRDEAIAAEEGRVDQEFIRQRRQVFIDLQREDEEARVLQSEGIKLPSREYWETISKLRDKRVNLDITEGESEDDKIVRATLKSKKTPPLKFDAETDIDKVAAYFKDVSGVPVLVRPQAREKASTSKFAVQLDHPISVESAINIVLAQSPELRLVVKNGAVIITTAEEAFGAPISIVHDVHDLLFGLTNFQGPRIMYLQIPGGKNRQGGVSTENPFGATLETTEEIQSTEIVQLIKDTIEPGSWEQTGVHIDEFQGQLVVTQSPEVQRKVQRFLTDLRRYTSSMVTIEARFVTISENFLQVIGVDWRGLPNQLDDVTNGLKDSSSAGFDNNGPGLPGNAGGTPSAGAFFDNGLDGSNIWRTEHLFDKPIGGKLTENGGLALQVTLLKGDQASMILKAVEKNFDVHEVNAQMLSVANNQRSYITVINQQSYIADYNVEVAQASFIAEPKIEILQSGVVLDVKPIINYNRKYITLELQPTVARIVQISDFTTTLGGLAGSVTFQLPQLAVQSAFTTAVVPDGGAVLIGGLKTLREVEARAEVPWLGRLPIIGFFFKKEGYDSETENLMVLIRATITDAREAMQKFETGIASSQPK